MKLVMTVGMSEREEAVFGIFLERSLLEWSWKGTSSRRGQPLPQADCYVVDLVGFGLARWSPAAEVEILGLLRGNPAVLVTGASDRTWDAVSAAAREQHALVLLPKPYRADEMRWALEKVMKQAPKPAAPHPTLAVQPAPAFKLPRPGKSGRTRQAPLGLASLDGPAPSQRPRGTGRTRQAPLEAGYARFDAFEPRDSMPMDLQGKLVRMVRMLSKG